MKPVSAQMVSYCVYDNPPQKKVAHLWQLFFPLRTYFAQFWYNILVFGTTLRQLSILNLKYFSFFRNVLCHRSPILNERSERRQRSFFAENFH